MAKILVVEDEIALRDLLTVTLSRAGHEVHCEADGHRGFQEAAFGDYDLMITDLEMPDWNGRTTLRSLAIVKPQMRVLVMSAYLAEQIYAQVGDEPNVASVMAKPFSIRDLRDQVARMTAPAPIACQGA